MAVPPEVAAIISRKKAQYGRYIDTKQWDKFHQIALPDAELSFLDSDGSVLKVGRTPLAFSSTKSFTTFFAKSLVKVDTLHMFGPGELEWIGPGEVKAIWGMEDQLIMNGPGGLVEVRGGGYFHETWKMKEGDWFLASLRLERTYTKTSPLARVSTSLPARPWSSGVLTRL
jgi:hypothetical protein